MKPRAAAAPGGLLRGSRLVRANTTAPAAHDLPPEVLGPATPPQQRPAASAPLSAAALVAEAESDGSKGKRTAGRWRSLQSYRTVVAGSWRLVQRGLANPLQRLLRGQQQAHASAIPLRRRSRRARLKVPSPLLLLWLLVALSVHLYGLWTGRIGFSHYPLRPVVWPHREPARRAVLRPLAVQNSSHDSCAQALQVPKVALLFLTTGSMPFELTWRKWLRSAEGLVPLAALAGSDICGNPADHHSGDLGLAATSPVLQQQLLVQACGRGGQQHWGQAGKQGALPLGVVGRQHLFSLYAHVPPGYPAFPPASLFSAAMIAVRVPTKWGTHTLVEATRELLWAAAADPANLRFVLLSESDLPLYDPLTFYQQLMSETKSRLNACGYPKEQTYVKSSMWRWTPPMQFDPSYWRKSSQWFVLTRRHAETVLGDVQIFRAFEEHCWSGWVPEYWRKRDCFSDEHYIPTLLAFHGLESECACEAWGGPAYMDWTGCKPRGCKAHPRTFTADEIKAELIRAARGEGTWQNCQARVAQEEAAAMFVHVEEVLGAARTQVCDRLQSQPLHAYAHPLPPTCALTARKFANDSATVRAVHALYRGCEGAGQGLLGKGYYTKLRPLCGPASY